MATEVMVRKWGNSLGVILPREVVEQEHLRESQKVRLQVVKVADFRHAFGALKGKISGQQVKDEARKGWEP